MGSCGYHPDRPAIRGQVRSHAAAERAVERIDALPEGAVSYALETNRVALLERMLHWHPHLDQIESAIGREI